MSYQPRSLFTHLTCFCVALIALGPAASKGFAAGATVNVPADTASIQNALNIVPDGGTIEIAGGTYNAPNGGFTIYPDLNGATKSFTVKAASSAPVVLNGNGNTDILRFTTPKLVTFQGITFANGFSSEDNVGGAISMGRNIQAHFVSCTFDNNAGNARTAGGGIRIDTSTVSFQSCSWFNNRSATYGAAFSAFNSRVFVTDCRFIGNRINFPGHSAFSAGGAIHANGSDLRIAHSRFENNQAGYVGGAIYAYGPWTDPNSVPTMKLTVSDTLFTNNIALPAAGTSQTANPAGGAVTLEDQTTAHFYNCRFTNNTAEQGGAISSYRTITDIHDSVFRNNTATGNSGSEGFGGSIIILSDDNRDDSTLNGTRNRPTAKLTVADSLFQGPPGNTMSARQGGAIFVAGDTHANFGIGVPQNGSVDQNRMVVDLKRVVFADFNTSDSGTGTGGALTGDFIALTAENCIFQNCSTSHFGGAMELVRQSKATIKSCSFAGNKSGLLGGALTMFGGSLNVNDSSFLDNRITGNGAGSAMFTSADAGGGTVPPSDMTGLMQNCVFNSATPAVMIYDGDSLSQGPYNRMQYSGNHMFPSDGSTYFTDSLGSFSVPALNALVRTRDNGSAATVKAPIPNIANTSPGVAGALVMVPRQKFSSGAPDESFPLPAYLGFTAGGATPSLNGDSQRASFDVVTAPNDGVHNLVVGGSTFSTSPVPASALNISTRLPVVAQGDGALIGGFIIAGPTAKRVIIRATGPSLTALGIAGVLQDPVLELHDASGTIASNDNWRTTQTGGLIGSSQVVDILASTIPPSNNAESALIATLNPGVNYTAVVRGVNNGAGIAVVEVFDLDPVQDATLANISTRGFIQTDDNVMFAGFYYLGGPGATRVVIRGMGPSLRAAGISNPLDDPVLELRDGNGALVVANDDASQSPNAAVLQGLGLLPRDPEAVIYQNSLPRGAYSAIARGKNRGVGVGLIEVYVFE
ncbi:MAG: hypothetical protein QOH88_2361 [Verrucomicrobiota bacterium]|jgi:predicted outer membrane repeat protein